MTATLPGEAIRSLPVRAPAEPRPESSDPQGAYNSIASAGLIYLDNLRAMEPALLKGAHTLAYFPYIFDADGQAPVMRAKVNHARESFLIGLALRSGNLSQIDELVDGLDELTPEAPERELLRFGGRVVLEHADFELDATVIDGGPTSRAMTERIIPGSEQLSGVSYVITPLSGNE